MLLERNRVGRRTSNDHTFNVLEQLIHGAEGQLQKELYLDSVVRESNPFITLTQNQESKHKSAMEFKKIQQAFLILKVEDASVRAVWSILGAIIHLGYAGAIKVGDGAETRFHFAQPAAACQAANLIGVSMEDLTNAVFPSNLENIDGQQQQVTDTGIDCLESFVIDLYSEVVAIVVALINKSICTNVHTISSILLVDTPGFQNPSSCGYQGGATLSDLVHNYLQERLQLLFHYTNFVSPLNRYTQELVEINKDGFNENSPSALAALIDKIPQTRSMRSSQRDLREHDKRGLFWMLDEESVFSASNDDIFLKHLFAQYSERENQAILRRGAGDREFILQHLQGTNPVLYKVNGWLKFNKEATGTSANASTLLNDSNKYEISKLCTGLYLRSNGSNIFGGFDGTQSLRRVTSIRRSFTPAVGNKKKSTMLQVSGFVILEYESFNKKIDFF